MNELQDFGTVVTLKLLGKVKEERADYEIEVLGMPLVVLPDVFSPKYCSDSEYFAIRLVELVRGKSLLEIGTGTGITALYCTRQGASVVATDINPAAVENCRLNAVKNQLQIDVRYGDMYDPVGPDEQFDVIFWNHPWNYSSKPVDDPLLKSGFDYQYASLKRYIREGRNFLKPDGVIILATGGFARLEEIEAYAVECGYKIRILHKDPVPTFEGEAPVTEFLMYEFRPA